MKRHFVILLSLLIFLFSSCFEGKNYSYVKWDFNIDLPKTIPSIYNSDDYPHGIGISVKRILILKIKPDEFKQYLGHLKFQRISDGLKGYNMEMVENGFRVYFKDDKGIITSEINYNKTKVNYDFNFKKGFIYIEPPRINRVILYDPNEEVIIFYAYSSYYKYPENIK